MIVKQKNGTTAEKRVFTQKSFVKTMINEKDSS